ncbi:hypothetical protein AF72_05235 [Xylella taiwanensis]|uniref:Uncharacterized protein n=1 Tax=Xylella taiwanensis TaxID=1444770 RepID=Z9JKW6_9GAMM|nr:hypothetical protein AB672_02550 [Xylella taiwanensis]EWS78476.1 hypothetical protein AF72_05235 [Xylella taiwanensis]
MAGVLGKMLPKKLMSRLLPSQWSSGIFLKNNIFFIEMVLYWPMQRSLDFVKDKICRQDTTIAYPSNSDTHHTSER